MKFGDRALIGAVLLATSLVADLQLIGAVIDLTISEHGTGIGLSPMVMSSIVSLSGGALLANITSVVIHVTETVCSAARRLPRPCRTSFTCCCAACACH